MTYQDFILKLIKSMDLSAHKTHHFRMISQGTVIRTMQQTEQTQLQIVEFVINVFDELNILMQVESHLSPIAIDRRSYRFFPTQKEQKTSFTKDGTRFYFFGQIKHDEYEKTMLAEFYKYLESNQIKVNTEFWTDQKILLFLQGVQYQNKEAYAKMLDHEKFRSQYLGENNCHLKFEEVAYLLRQGMFYVSGRDRQFRPVLVYNAKKIDLKDFQRSFKATIFVQEQVIAKMFIPGQVESWDIIYDLAGMGISEIPISTLKSLIQKISSHYGGRLYKLWVVNAPMTVSISWKIISAFIDPVTVNKTKISKSKTEKDIFNLCDPSQVQKKYGGTQPDRTSYWPLEIPEGVFDVDRLVSDLEYEKKLESGELRRNAIDPQFAEKHKALQK